MQRVFLPLLWLSVLATACQAAPAVRRPPRSSQLVVQVPTHANRVGPFQADGSSYRPLVVWHGMGDSCCDQNSLAPILDAIQEEFPGIMIYSIMLGDNEDEDRRSSYQGNINEQLENVKQMLQEMPELEDGFNAIGFSQGGQFLRAHVERYNEPPVYNLITVGAQHQGIASAPHCAESSSWYCAFMNKMFRLGAYSDAVQTRIIQAQYYKDNKNMPAYLEKSIFLADINNEREVKNSKYVENLLQLNSFAMVKFANDTMVVPKDSSWFGYLGDGSDETVPLRDSLMYKEDWLGLKALDEDGRLLFFEAPGDHLQLSMEFIRENLFPFLAE